MPKQQIFLQWDSTNNCNLKCRHCYHGREGQEKHFQKEEDLISLIEVKSMLDDLSKTAKRWNMIPRFHISGGEPLMRKDLQSILEYSQLKEISTRLLTNGTLITPEKARMFKEKGMKRLQISLDGNKEKHNYIRQKSYAFDRAIRGIKNSQNAGIGVTISFTAMQSNKTDIEQAIKCSIEAGADVFGIQSYVPDKRIGIKDPEFIDAQGTYEIYKNQRELDKKYGNKIRLLETEVLWNLNA